MSNWFFAQAQDSTLSSSRLKKMSLEELMNVEVISISMRPEKLTEVASAIQVITREDIHRSGVSRLPEALRLASNLHVARANSHDWSITARGFSGLPTADGVLANKLLVMIDGRSIYTPLFGGVYWDVQNLLLEDIDRIEVVSGPGGTLWGANAVNGVINIITKSAKETQGVYVSGARGSFLQDLGEVRFGSRIDSTFFFRVYGQRIDQRSTGLANGIDSVNPWNRTQGGFRMDYYPSKANTVTLQGDFYDGDEKSLSQYAFASGQNVLGRFTHLFSERSNFSIQLYFDRTWRKTPNAQPAPFNYEAKTYDADIQHRFALGSRQSILWGGGYRLIQDKATHSLNPLGRDMPLFSGFVQDEIAFVADLLKLTIGSKFLHNVFTGFEIQPSGRIAWTPDKRHTIWAAISRAVRTPSRFDVDFIKAPIKFISEDINAYEMGYRARPIDRLSLSLAVFYNKYSHLRSLNKYPSTTTPVILANSQRAESWGFELSGNFQTTDWWRLRSGYTYFEKKISATSPDVLPISADFEGDDPRNQFMLQSIMDLPKHLQLDLMGRYADVLKSTPPTPSTPAYFAFDVRLAWQFKSFEISLIGQDLPERQHAETGLSKIPRSIYGRVRCQF